MKKRRFSLVLTLALVLSLLCGCAGSSDTPEPDPEPELTDPVQPTPEGSVIAIGFSSLDEGAQAAVSDFLHTYYRSIGTLKVEPCASLFTTAEEAARHRAIWHTLIEIRKASLIDLRLEEYHSVITLTDAQFHADGTLTLTATEDVVVRFLATAQVESQQFGTIHTFTLQRTGQDSWLIALHESDDNPYYSFQYDEERGQDARLDSFLQDIALRQTQLDKTDDLSALHWDHDYDRSAAYTYMQTYIETRNPIWYAYDELGGNCQNFGSQVLLSGGIPMDQQGDAIWYWNSFEDQNFSWINVPLFMDYAKTNTGYGLVSLPDAAYYTGQTGDILIYGDDDYDHTTVIADTITDESGRVVDYLVCSNTSNYRNFPASAYYYTKQWLVRIFGWNE